MNLHHLDKNDKESFVKKLFSSVSNKILGTAPTSSDHSINASVPVSEEVKNNLKESTTILSQATKSNTSQDKLIELFDRAGRPYLHDFTSGNICVFGDDAREVDNFTDLLLSKLSLIHHAVEVVDAVEFSKKRRRDSSTPFLIKVSSLIPSRLLQTIIQNSVTICVLKLKDNAIVCALDGRAKSGVFARELINNLGGDRALRELMIASLARDEFLLIENTCFDQSRDTEAARCFQTIIKQQESNCLIEETSSWSKSLRDEIQLPCSQRITNKG